MRFYFAFVIIAFACIAPASAQEPEFPYNAIVLDDDATVHSGPGDSHYATHKLNANDIVEVYRHDPGGWCAIRPPVKSFSLLPASSVKRISNDVAEVLANGSQAWVGTALGPVEKPLWQVKLEKGERVAIVGEATWPHPSGKSVVWLQIEPPAGEYRWIRLADLQLPPEEDTATKEIPFARSVDYSIPPSFGKNKTTRTTSPAEPSFPSTSKTGSDQSEEFSSGASLGWKSATRPIPKAKPIQTQFSGTFGSPTERDDPQSGFVEQATYLSEQELADSRFESWDGSPIPKLVEPPPMDRFASLEPASSMEQHRRSFVRDRSNSTAPRQAGQRGGFNAQNNARKNSTVMAIEEKLSAEILKDPHSWNLAELKFETERAKARSVDPVERLAFQHVMDKISKCDRLCKSYQQASPFSASMPTATQPFTSANSPYDASGWLKRLANSSGSLDPHYVLQDSLGNVTHEVVGMAGMNLGQYVDKKVGVIGRRGRNQRLGLNHVTVNRIVVVR